MVNSEPASIGETVAQRIDWSTARGREGFFRVARTKDGVWWLIDPWGKPLYYKGVCALNRAGTPGGRYARPGPYHHTIGRLYGEDPHPFIRSCFKMLRDMEFNALGAWAGPDLFDQGMPWTEILECSKDAPPYPVVEPGIRLRGAGIDLPDVFDAVWHRAIDRSAARLCAVNRDSRLLVGYFTDNELGWGQPKSDHIWGAPGDGNSPDPVPSLLQVCLTLPTARPARDEAWKFALSRHGCSPVDVGASWGIAIDSADKLAELTAAGVVLDSPSYRADHQEFSYRFACAYFERTKEAVRRHDPNHLLLGCRFGAPPGEPILRACTSERLDVVSANNYRDTFRERIDEYYRPTAMPILIGEFAWASDYFSVDPACPQSNSGCSDRIRHTGPAALLEAASHPGLLGYTWYRWVSKHPPHTPTAYGLVDYNHVLNDFHAPLLAGVNAQLARLHANLH